MISGIVMQSGYFAVPPFKIWPGDGYRLDFEEEITLNILVDRVDQTEGIAYFNRTA